MKKFFTLLLAFFLILNTAYIRPVFAEEPVTEEPVATEEVETEEVIPEEEVVEEQPVEEVSEETLLENDSLGIPSYPDVVVEHYYQVENPDGSLRYAHDRSDDYMVTAEQDTFVLAIDNEGDTSNFAEGRHLVTTNKLYNSSGELIENIHLVPYIESNGTQFIDTGVNMNTGTEIYAKFSLVDQTTDDQTLFGVTEHLKSDAFYRFDAEINVQNLYFNYGVGHNLGDKRQLTRAVDKNIHEITLGKGGLEFDGMFYQANSDSYNMTDTRDTTLFVFANNDGNGHPENFGSYRLYHLAIREGMGGTVIDLYPAIATDTIDRSMTNTGRDVPAGTLGLYDAYHCVFYVSQARHDDDFTCDERDLPYCFVDGTPEMQYIRLYYDLDRYAINFYNYDEDGDSYCDERIYHYGDTLVNLDVKPDESFDRQGYTFDGWSLDDDGDLSDDWDITYDDYSDEPYEYYVDYDEYDLLYGAIQEGDLYDCSVFSDNRDYYDPFVDYSFDYYAYYEPNDYRIVYYTDYNGNNIMEDYTTSYYDIPLTVDYPSDPNYRFTGWVITGLDESCEHSINGVTFTGSSYETNVQLTDLEGECKDVFENLSSKDGDVIFFKAKFVPWEAVEYGYDYYIELRDDQYDWDDIADYFGDYVEEDINDYVYLWDWDDDGDRIVEIDGHRYYRLNNDLDDDHWGMPGEFVYPRFNGYDDINGYLNPSSYTVSDKLNDIYEVTKAVDIFEHLTADEVNNGIINMDGKENPEIFVLNEIHSNFSLDAEHEVFGGQSINTGLKAEDVYKVDMDVDMTPTGLLTLPGVPATLSGGYMFGTIKYDEFIQNMLSAMEEGESIGSPLSLVNDNSGLSLLMQGGRFMSFLTEESNALAKQESLSEMFAGATLEIANFCGGHDEIELPMDLHDTDGHMHIISSRDSGTRELTMGMFDYEYYEDENFPGGSPFADYKETTRNLVTGGNIGDIAGDQDFYLFGSPNADLSVLDSYGGIPFEISTFMSLYFYSQFGLFESKIYGKDNVLLRDFVPCVTLYNLSGSYVNDLGEVIYLTNTGKDVPAGTYGLYDKVENKFYVNEGSGAFTNVVSGYNRNRLSMLPNGETGVLSSDYADDGYPDERNVFSVFLKLKSYDLNVLEEPYVASPVYPLDSDYGRATNFENEPIHDEKDELYYGDDINNYLDEYGNIDASKVDSSIYSIAQDIQGFTHLYKKIGSISFKAGQYIRPDVLFDKLSEAPMIKDGKYIATGLSDLFPDVYPFTIYEEYDYQIPSQSDDSYMMDEDVNIFVPYINEDLRSETAQMIIGSDDYWIDEFGCYHVLPGTEISFAGAPDSTIIYSIDYEDNRFSDDIYYEDYNEHITINEDQYILVYQYERGKNLSYSWEYYFYVDNEEDIRNYRYAQRHYHGIPEGLWIGDLPDACYYPDVKEFKYDVEDIPVYYNYTRLSPDQFSVKYSNNKHAGKATITVTAKGGFSGSFSTDFEIDRLELNHNFVRITLDADAFKYKKGKVQKPKVKEFVVIGPDNKEYKLKENTDYVVNYQNPNSSEIDDYSLRIRILKDSNYEWDDRPLVYEYTISNNTVASQLKIKGISDVNYYDLMYLSGRLPIEVFDGKTPVYDFDVYYDVDSEGEMSYPPRLGTHTVTLFFDSYSGSITKTFKVKGNDISKATFENKVPTTYDYDDGKEITIDELLLFKHDGVREPLYEFVQYYKYYTDSKGNPLVDEEGHGIAPTLPGSYKVVYVGNEEAGFTGTKTVSFKIKGLPLTKYGSVDYSKEKHYYTGEEITLTPEEVSPYYTKNGQKQYLYPTGNYTYEITNNVNAGTATVTYTGIGVYTGTSMKKTFKIEKRSLTDPEITVDTLGTQPYSKKTTMPTVVIHQGEHQLVEGVDFTVSCTNNKAITTGKKAVATVKGKGNYTGSLKLEFEIGKQDIVNTTMIVNDATTSTLNNAVIYDVNGNKLEKGVDYDFVRYYFAHDSICGNTQTSARTLKKAGTEITRFDVLYPGTIVKVEATGINNYYGLVSAEYKIVEEDISKAKVTVRKQYYTGKAINVLKEDITIVSNGKRLYSDDFDIIGYTNNTNVGTATVTVRGKGKFGGIQTVKFTIAKRPLDSVIVKFYSDNDYDRYNIVNNYGYDDYTISGTMDDMVLTKNTKLNKNKFKNSNSELKFLGWYCPETDYNDVMMMTNNMTRRNRSLYYAYEDNNLFEFDSKLVGSEIHMYAVWGNDEIIEMRRHQR